MIHVFESLHMGTRVNLTVHSAAGRESLESRVEAVWRVFGDLEARFSLFRPDSELCRLNAAASRPFVASAEMRAALRLGLEMARQTGGRFCPVRRLDTGAGVDGKSIEINDTDGTVRLPADSAADLNAVIKGLAVDLGITAFGGTEPLLLEAGGDLRVRGLPPDRDRWSIGIRDPFRPERLYAAISLMAGAVCTSGEYFRRRPGRPHLVGTRATGEPAPASVTVVAGTAAAADILSTAGWFYPPEECVAMTEGLGHPGLVILADGTVRTNQGFNNLMS